jgi:general secretion pathway protein A
MANYREYYGFKTEPFHSNISPKNLLRLPDMLATKERLDYALSLGGVMLVTGEVGAGKSTTIRWALSHYHPSEIVLAHVIATSASLNELYKQFCWSLDLDVKAASRAYLARTFRGAVRDIVVGKKQKVVLVIDEASLLRADVFSEIHTLTQFEHDSQSLISIVLLGQIVLLDKLTYRSSQPLASRVVTKTHLRAISREQMVEYLNHHLRVAGVKKPLFSDSAVTAIHQGSGGLLRSANHLARGGLIAAAVEGQDLVQPDHIRIASTELFTTKGIFDATATKTTDLHS